MFKLIFRTLTIFVLNLIIRNCQTNRHDGPTPPSYFVTDTDRDNEKGKMPQESCLNAVGVPYVKHFANTRNCSTFWFCWEVSPGIPMATEYICPFYLSKSGQMELLSWNFIDCVCDYPWNTTCYDELDTRHTLYRYNCAKPLSLSVILY